VGTTGGGATASGGFDPLLDPEINDGARDDGASVNGTAVCPCRIVGLAVELYGAGVASLAATVVVGHAMRQRRSLLPASAMSVTYERISG